MADVTKRFRSGVMAVDRVTMRMEPGVVGLLGANGAGKTTLMQMLATVTRPTSGAIRYHGTDVVRNPVILREHLGYLPQDFGVYEGLTAFEMLAYFASLKGVFDRTRIFELLELVNLHTVADRDAATFSGGMRQRLGIAQALVNDPDVVILDEPTAGLDPEERVRLRGLLSDLGADRLVVYSTHIVSDIESIATHIAIMARGQLVCDTTPDALLRRAVGSVWTGTLPREAFELVRRSMRVSRSIATSDGMQVRVVHPTQPFDGAVNVAPELEDAYLLVTDAPAGLTNVIAAGTGIGSH